MPGLYKIVATRDNGLIVCALGSDKKKFISSRQHMFTPLENITIYTEDDSVELVTVLVKMKEEEKKNPIISPNSKGEELRKYFTSIVPDHDHERVYTSDIKKVVKWYTQLDENKMLVVEKEVKEDKKPKAKAKAKPKAKPKAKKK